MAIYKIREEGRNGTIEVLPDRLVRTIKKVIGRDDTQTIPIKSIHEVKLDRRIGRSDIVRVVTSAATYEWKCPESASLHEELQQHLFA